MAVKGDVVLVNFPFTNLSQTKLRPAVILWVDRVGTDIVVCAITSQNPNDLDDGEFLLDSADPEFAQTGLRVASKVRTTRIATLDRQLAVRKLGQLGIQSMLSHAYQITLFQCAQNMSYKDFYQAWSDEEN